jgi:hypothetical protein
MVWCGEGRGGEEGERAYGSKKWQGLMKRGLSKGTPVVWRNGTKYALYRL